MESAGDHDRLSIVRIFGQEVKNFSSQYGAEERMSYAAQNLAGDSNIFPSYGDFTQACVFRTYGPWWRMAPSVPKPFRKTPEPNHLASEDFIEVLFGQCLYPVAVHIYETYNPGAVVRILGCDHQAGTSVDTGTTSKWRTLWSGAVTETARRSRIFSPPIRKIDTPVNLIRLELNHSLLHYYTELDCIMLCGVARRPHPHHYPLLQDQAQPLSTHARHHQPHSGPDQGDQQAQGGKWWGGVEGVLSNLQSLSISTGDTTPTDNNTQDFSMLPGEIIIMILGYLDFPSLARVAQTCKLLQRHAYDSILYTELNLQPVWNLVGDRTLEGLALRCDNLQRLNLSWCSVTSVSHKTGFARLLQTCRDTLTCLHLSCCSFLTQETLTLITSTCTHLRDLDVSGCGEVDKVSGMLLTQLINLERLNLYRTKIDTDTMVKVIRCVPKLKYLNVGSCKLISHSDEVVDELGLCCPDLRSLDMWRARNLENSSFQRFIDSCPLLEELDLGWCSQLSSRMDSFTRIAEKCKNLKKLFLTANRTVCDVDVLALAQHSRHLQQLDILGTREVTSEALEKVLMSCCQLVMVDVSFCAGITDDHVQLWNHKYPQVNIKKSFQN
ncbi:F-box/LRR-repeat protein 4-like isoform X2 [Babylonia areolata]